MLWEVDIHPAEGQPDLAARQVRLEAAELGLSQDLRLRSARGFLLEGELGREDADRIARELLADTVVERPAVGAVGDAAITDQGASNEARLVHVLPKPDVMDPVAESTIAAIADMGLRVRAVRTLRKYWFDQLSDEQLRLLRTKVLANDAIEEVIVGPLTFDRLAVGAPYSFKLQTVPLSTLDEAALVRLSREGQLYLSLAEMQTIQTHFRGLGREPTDIELETVAQTWSEHCSHKTLKGRIHYRDESGSRHFQNMLKETIFAATQSIRRTLGADDWCVSVFEDNAGVVTFDDHHHVVFKVETHNHPSALEPYGGANTGLGGVIRDPLGTGLGAKPICNTDVFCFAPPDTPAEEIPPGVLHPRRVMRGVVSGVRDYGNRMGIPTVNGAVYFDPRYLGNPLVYCGNVGLLPKDKARGAARPGDLIVAVGGRTGRDGIHGATFSSAELTSESESVSGGAVQIGNAITEKKVLDVILAARDRELYTAITDCGAGGFSSAVGEMGAKIGAQVWLDRVPLKYDGLSYTEIWISEAQERMVVAVPPEKWEALAALCRSEGVEATAIGEFLPTGRLKLIYHDHEVGDLSMEFLHDGQPPVVREAVYQPAPIEAFKLPEAGRGDWTPTLTKILGSLNVASKEWIIRQYDHEVQGGSVVKPLVGVSNDGPGDAAVVRPVLGSRRGVVVACGMNPQYGDFDTYDMAASAIDEAIRNCIAVGADPARIAILDNFCWGDCERAETLGSLVRAALACQDLAVAFGTPFISGKDSLNNEFKYTDTSGQRQSIAIPPSLLISAIGQIDDVSRAVTMDLKRGGNYLYLVGTTRAEMGGSHLNLVEGGAGGLVPKVIPERALATFRALHGAIRERLVRACHDLSEGGLAVALAEMAFAGGLGAEIELDRVLHDMPPSELADATLLFSESNSRFLCEVAPEQAAAFEGALGQVPLAKIGQVTETGRVQVCGLASTGGKLVIDEDIAALKEAWQAPLRW
ncbi:MAG: phosphoribosylformylglycinamidine synthase subunit PurL [Pirellulales bacterium]|nr:phosphoribosylformylglycinamidine synthase subunit PurL [Pirellulales bacterium]